MAENEKIALSIHRQIRGSSLAQSLAEREEFEINFPWLTTGNYEVEGLVRIWYMTATEFLESLMDKELFSGARDLRNANTRALIMVEGNPYETAIQIGEKAIRGAIVSLTAFWQVPLVMSTGQERTGELLVMMGRQAKKRWEDVRVKIGYKPRKPEELRLYLLQDLPEVGPKRARLLLDHFGTVEKVMKATGEELAEISGIGPKIAGQIREVVSDSDD